MSDPRSADSALDPGEATGENLTDVGQVSDSTPTPDASGQEQLGDQSSEKRINGLQSVLGRRTSERDAALAELEDLRQQLDAATAADQQASVGKTQAELVYPERYAQPEPESDVDPMAPPEPPVIVMGVNVARPDHNPAYRPAPNLPDASTPAARYARDQAEIATLKAELNVLGQQWYEQAKES